MSEEQTKIIPKIELPLMGGSIGAFPEGSFVKDGKTIEYQNRVKYFQSGKAKMVLHSQQELDDLAMTLTGCHVEWKGNALARWAKKHLPETGFVEPDEDELSTTD